MKKQNKMQALFFLLIPVGIVLLVVSIKMVQKSFNGKIIMEIPYLQKSAAFEITKSGNYSIWHRGQYWRRAPLDKFRPVVTNMSTRSDTNLNSLLFRPNVNNGIRARMELFRFSAPAGKYQLELAEGSSITGLENTFLKLIPSKMVDYDQYFIQVRESQPFIIVVAGILLMVISAFCIIGGLVIGILADKILINNG